MWMRSKHGDSCSVLMSLRIVFAIEESNRIYGIWSVLENNEGGNIKGLNKELGASDWRKIKLVENNCGLKPIHFKLKSLSEDDVC